ncbi:hypothetical protein IU479_25040 [Nocardia abscessus]|uniref:hypothetical protein n=1 Tax=Nocardia abscessus TaxID=120957 RepID=UPI0018962CFC|nr:hypothetical protein [Nocardia abscessus]MBF6221373.1 hypothetical protein [Nocardia abscessus]
MFPIATAICAMLMASFIGIGAWLLVRSSSRRTSKLTVAAIKDRLSHDAPHRQLSLSQAREQLSYHRGCDHQHCARRRAIDRALNAATRHQLRAISSDITKPLPRITD